MAGVPPHPALFPEAAVPEAAVPEALAPEAPNPEVPAVETPGTAGVPAELPSAQAGGESPLAGTHVAESSDIIPLGLPGSWQLVLDEEFDTLDRSLWTPYWFRDCDLQSKKNNVRTCSANITVTAGEAVLQLSDEESGALLSTNPRDGAAGHLGFEYTSGYVEARILFPGTCSGGIYNWPAWWTTGQSYPATGEIDIAEPLRGDMTTVYHAPDHHQAQWVFGCWAGQYHTYGVHRKAGSNDIYFDGRRIYSYPTKDGNAPHYLLLNVGSSSGPRAFGEAGATRVDYVRVWQ